MGLFIYFAGILGMRFSLLSKKNSHGEGPEALKVSDIDVLFFILFFSISFYNFVYIILQAHICSIVT